MHDKRHSLLGLPKGAPWLLSAKYQQILTWCLTLFFLGCTLLPSVDLYAQAVSGTILGTVTDPGGSAVTNAQVIIVLTGQETTYNTITN